MLLSESFSLRVNSILPGTPECSVGAQTKTQCLDIAHGLQFVIEKGLDNIGNSAVAQCDIEKYFASLPVLRIMCWLVSNGTQLAHAACLVRQKCDRRCHFNVDLRVRSLLIALLED